MFKLRNLVSITVPYTIDESLRGKGLASSVILTFATLDSAMAFSNKMNPSNPNYLEGAEIFNVKEPAALANGFQVCLELKINQIILGNRADVVLAVLKNRYKLPAFNVSYPESLSSNKIKTVTVPITEYPVVGNTLSAFLEIRALEQSNLPSRFKQTLGVTTKVARQPSANNNPTSLQITFDYPNALLLFKEKLYLHALKDGFDEEFRIEKISGVAGIQHKDMCLIRINPGYSFVGFLEHLVNNMEPLPQEILNHSLAPNL